MRLSLLHFLLLFEYLIVTVLGNDLKIDDNFTKNNNETENIEEEEEEPDIVNGVNAPPGRYPYMTSLVQSIDSHFCGASLIAPDVILTAAHCVDSIGLGDFRLDVGRYDRSDGSEQFQIGFPTQLYIDPLWDANDVGAGNDLAIIRTPYPMTTGEEGNIVKINRNSFIPSIGSNLMAMGWGRISTDGPAASILQETTITAQTCVNPQPTVVCASSSITGTCFGDSGGPLIVAGASPKDDILVGASSYVIGSCASGFPSGFYRVSSGDTLIEDIVCAYSSMPPADFNCPNIQRLPPEQFTNPVVLRFEIPLDFNARQRGWYLQYYNDDNFLVTQAYVETYNAGQNSQTVIEEVTVEAGYEYHLILTDTVGDGDFSFGSILVYINGEFSDSFQLSFNFWFSTLVGTIDLVDFYPTSKPTPMPTSHPTFSEDTRFITIVFVFDNNSDGIGFIVEALSDDGTTVMQVVASAGPGTYNEPSGTRIEETVILLPLMDDYDTQHYSITITDSFGDGLLSPGFYEIWYRDTNENEGTLLQQGSNFGSSETTTFVDPHIIYKGFSPSSDEFPLGRCEGDCDDDSDCRSGLVCFNRNGDQPIRGCSGGVDGETTTADFCTHAALPTQPPSNQPTLKPSDKPSIRPSVKPSMKPSPKPSFRPSVNPTLQPSEKPSTMKPSALPSFISTISPKPSNNIPTVMPSWTPSIGPSAQPFAMTFKPTLSPMPSQTIAPSEYPSAMPSLAPTLDDGIGGGPYVFTNSTAITETNFLNTTTITKNGTKTIMTTTIVNTTDTTTTTTTITSAGRCIGLS